MNAQQSNQFNYQTYHNDQLAHQQYFDESHVQTYNYIPYTANETYSAPVPPNEPIVAPQESFPAIQSSELYEFLPEEIFQLDQPILKSETQPFINANVPVDSLQMPFTSHNVDVNINSHSFLDLSSGQIQTNVKYPPMVEGFAYEINNNSGYQSNNVNPARSKTQDINSYYQVNHETSTRLTCAVENEKAIKRKNIEMEHNVKTNPSTLQQNYQHQQIFAKRENSCVLYQSANYYPPDLYTNFPSKSNDVYRTMDKYNSFLTNN